MQFPNANARVNRFTRILIKTFILIGG